MRRWRDHAKNRTRDVIRGVAMICRIDEYFARRCRIKVAAQLFDFVIANDII
jgi:hypothetical protein